MSDLRRTAPSDPARTAPVARWAAVIGHPVSHSRSPALFARFAAASGVALAYDAVDVPPEELAETLARWRAMPEFVGCNVTLPHKERALALADRVEPAARACGAVNVLTRLGTTLVADNTDVAGVEAALARYGVELRGARVAILGAGGAARAVAEASRRSAAASITIAARDRERAQAVAADFGAAADVDAATDVGAASAPHSGATEAYKPAHTVANAANGTHAAESFSVETCSLDDVPVADVYVNATPVGMLGQAQYSLLPASAPAGAAAFDLVYVPEETPFLLAARARGMRVVPGTAMFLAQAAATFRLWFGFAPPDGALTLVETIA